MRIKAMLKVTLIVILFSAYVQACSGIGTSSTASSTSKTAFDMGTSIEVDEIDIRPEMSSNTLRINEMSLEAGRLSFKLSSSDGNIQWEESFTAPADYKHTFDLDVMPGVWKLEIELEDATGNYNIEWRASD